MPLSMKNCPCAGKFKNQLKKKLGKKSCPQKKKIKIVGFWDLWEIENGSIHEKVIVVLGSSSLMVKCEGPEERRR